MLANQPTRGLDIGATAEVHRRLLEARERGVGVVLISEDLDELLALSDRVAGDGCAARFREPLAVESVTLERLGLMMAGHAEAGMIRFEPRAARAARAAARHADSPPSRRRWRSPPSRSPSRARRSCAPSA